jgi:hypothetical protein
MIMEDLIEDEGRSELRTVSEENRCLYDVR